MRKFRISKKRLQYYLIKLARQSGTPECVAKGVGLGLFTGFFIPMGLQIVIVLPLAVVLKANKITACVFTMVSNHFTVPFLYPFQCVLGSYVIANPLTYAKVKQVLMEFIRNPTWDELVLMGREVLVPFLVGGTLLAVTTSFLGYFMTLRIVRNIRNRKAKRRLRSTMQQYAASVAQNKGAGVDATD